MGMAASQARLLSITTRLSDNELRSQLINNQKIRLATESSKASERYVAALNNTKMMYSAYDVKGNPLNKELTFANLTAYSSYNNQYGLRNLSGQILVSEETAHNYENAVKAAENNTETTALEEFLKSYNLEKGTTFFDGVTTDIIDACLGMPEGESSGLTGADLKAMYLGGADTQGTVHEGYDAILSGTEYNKKFEPLFTEYMDSYDAYLKAMDKYIEGDFLNNSNVNMGGLKGSIGSITDYNSANNVVNDWKSKLTNLKNKLGIQGDSFFDDFSASLDDARNEFTAANVTVDNGNLIIDDVIRVTSTGIVSVISGAEGADKVSISMPAILTGDPKRFNLTVNGQSGTMTVADPSEWSTNPWASSPLYFDQAQAISTLTSYYNNFLKELPNHLDMNKLETLGGIPEDVKDAITRYKDAAQKLSIYMFGSDMPEHYQELNDLQFIFEQQLTNDENGNNFASVLDVLILDAVLNELGDPNVTWIDTTNPNEDATAKAQWYTNLFNRMQTVTTTEKDDGTITEEIKTNYQVLEDGLATSAEWLQFALESGLVSMEQVDANNNWCSTLYSNCSDITETTDANEATVAEAEYNATMAKIEAKDKQFDIQLKNIDTEHESLQTEYDSIKSVLDKNIERNFKMYSA